MHLQGLQLRSHCPHMRMPSRRAFIIGTMLLFSCTMAPSLLASPFGALSSVTLCCSLPVLQLILGLFEALSHPALMYDAEVRCTAGIWVNGQALGPLIHA